MRRTLSLLALTIVLAFTCRTAAAQPTAAETTVMQIIEEFKGAQGVNCMAIGKNEGLGFVKEIFKAKFGKEFMKDVTFIALIEYTRAASETRAALQTALDKLTAPLHKFATDDKQLKEGQQVKCFATLKDEKLITDFMILLEENNRRMYIYMGGTLHTDKMELQK